MHIDVFAAPAGENPYAYSARLLQAAFHPEPSPNFVTRLYVLGALCLLTILITLFTCGVFAADARRGGQHSLWLWKWVGEKGNALILINSRVGLVGNIVAAVVFMCYLKAEYEVLVKGGDQCFIIAWRSSVYWPLLVKTWLHSWAMLQTRLVLDCRVKHKDMSKFMIRSVNLAFPISTVVVFGSLIAVQVLTIKTWKTLWDSYYELAVMLEAGTRSNTVSPIDLETLQNKLDALCALLNIQDSYEVGLKCIWAVIFALGLALSLLSISFYRTVQHQIRQNDEVYAANTTASSCTQPEDDLSDDLNREFAEERNRALYHASMKISHMGIAVSLISAACLAFFVWIITVPTLYFSALEPWRTLELSLFCIIWVFAVLTPSAMAVVALKMIRALLNQRAAQGAPTFSPSGPSGGGVEGIPQAVNVQLEKSKLSEAGVKECV